MNRFVLIILLSILASACSHNSSSSQDSSSQASSDPTNQSVLIDLAKYQSVSNGYFIIGDSSQGTSLDLSDNQLQCAKL